MPNPDRILDGEPFFTVYHTVYCLNTNMFSWLSEQFFPKKEKVTKKSLSWVYFSEA